MRSFCKTLVLLLLAAVMLSGCGKNTAENDGEKPEDNDITVSDGKTYSVDAGDILGIWHIVYYSDDNENYKDYQKDVSENGFYSFYDDGTAVIQNDEDDSKVVLYNAEDGIIKLFDIDTGNSLDYCLGYGVKTTESGNCIIATKYNYVDRSVRYLILKYYEID